MQQSNKTKKLYKQKEMTREYRYGFSPLHEENSLILAIGL
jgi:hypothetical protein